MDKPKLLLHSCCAPCSTTGITELKEDYHLTICYYNPNIYPEEEYIKRKNEQLKLIDIFNSQGYDIKILDADYDFEEFENAVVNFKEEKEGGKRCSICFALRLNKVAFLAKQNAFDYFATTLTVSPHKNAELINGIGEQVGVQHGIKYLPTNFKKKDGYKRSVEMSKKLGLYRQNYCGCKYSIWF